MGQVIKIVQCPLCAQEGYDTAEDNAHVFDSGYANCVARHGSIGKINQATVKKIERPKSMTSKKSKFKEGEYADIKSRNLKKSTCEFYGYMINREEQCHIANYYDAAGQVQMQQIRTVDKQFPIIGNKIFNETLWGSHLFTPSDNVFITITEGQIDALSVAQAFNCKYPVVSLPNGASSAKSVLLKNKKYLDGFKYVVLAFDNDGPGKEATEECMKVLEPGKVKIARWTKKDANDLLKDDKESEIRDIVYRAVEYIPEPILTGDNLLRSLETYTSRTMEWPFKNAQTLIQPIRIPAVYTIAARPQIGKTEFVGEIMRSIIGNGGKVGVISLEQTMQQILIKLTDTLTGSRLSEVTNRQYTPEEIEICKMVSENLVIYDHITYGSDLMQVVENIPYMIKALGCEIVVFDNLSYSATAHKGDERRGIDQAMIALKDSTIKYDYTLFNVCHIKREDVHVFGDDDSLPVMVEDIRGSQGVEMYSDYIIGLHRDKNNENLSLRNTLEAYILKDRMTGNDTGKKFIMRFDSNTRRLS